MNRVSAVPQRPSVASKKKKPNDIEKLIDDKLATSALGPKERAALKICAADPAELKSIKLPSSAPAMEIPYFDIAGKKIDYRRWRYLADSRSAFDKVANVKEKRYVQPPDTLCRLYYPPLVDWPAIAKDCSRSIIFTEGELKAACASANGFSCIGLGGVWSFKSTKKGIPLIRDFKDFDWEGRGVVVMFDSDADSNPMVVGARNALCRELFMLGALPAVAQIPAREDGHKQGLDDLVLAEGPEALSKLIEEAESWSMAEELHRLNEEVCYIKDPGLVIVLKTKQRISARDFMHHVYADRSYLVANPAGKMVPKLAAKAWIEWPKRLMLRKMVYAPGKEQITRDACYNIWPGWGCEPIEGDITPWRQLLDHIFQGFPAERSWFERWCALPIQQPGMKMFTAAVIWGIMTGTGKSLLGYSMGRVYGQNFVEISEIELSDARHEWAENKQFAMGDDVAGQEQRKFADRLKAMITRKEMRIDRKFIPSFSVEDRINYIFTSNHPDALFLDDHDRRYFVHEACMDPMPKAFYETYMTWLNGDGPAHLFHHLLTLDLDGMTHADRAPETAARQAMVEDGQSDLATWVRALRAAPDGTLKLGEKVLAGDLWSAKDLLDMYDPEHKTRVSANGISRELKRAGFKQVYRGMAVKLRDGKQSRLFIMRNYKAWEDRRNKSSKEIAEHYEETRLGGNKTALQAKF